MIVNTMAVYIYSSHFPIITQRFTRLLVAWLMRGGWYMIIGGFYRAHLTFPPEYPLLPPKMTFQSPIFHPNSQYIPPPPPSPFPRPLLTFPSLPNRRRLHLHPTRPNRRPLRLRIRLGALVARADSRNDFVECYFHAEQS